MSDITKKIFSIEQTEDTPNRSEPSISDIVRPLADEKPIPIHNEPETREKVPEFVTRETVNPLSAPPSIHIEEAEPSKAAGWIILAMGVLYLIGAGLFFGLPLLSQAPLGLLPIAGLAVLLTLPLILLFLLWRALRHLNAVSQQNVRMSKAAEALVSPDREALARTETLAGGIRAEISRVNKDLIGTVDVIRDVQTAMTQESQALDLAGAALSRRSDDVGQNLTIQRQALESLSDSIDARMNALSLQISEKGQKLDEICIAAETKILNAGGALDKVSTAVDKTATSGADRIGDKITALEETRSKLAETTEAFALKMGDSTEMLLETDKYFAEYAEKFEGLNTETQSQIRDLQAIIGHGYELLENLKTASETQATDVAAYYENLSNQMKRAEDDTLAAQGETARMVETNLAQMRRDFSRMETDMQSLQVKLNRLRDASDRLEIPEPEAPRLNLRPLDSDFPPVEPPRHVSRPKRAEIADSPMNLGVDMEIDSVDEPLVNFEPDVIRRPGEVTPKPQNAAPKSKGFGRRGEKEEKSGWHWRDMLGSLERPDDIVSKAAPNVSLSVDTDPTQDVDGVALLTALKLSPAAIVDEGTVIDATQARINSGEPGLTSVIKDKLPEAVAHLKQNMAADRVLKADLHAFTAGFSKMIGNTPPTAPALRAAFGSPEGRAYLLCAAAFSPDLR